MIASSLLSILYPRSFKRRARRVALLFGVAYLALALGYVENFRTRLHSIDLQMAGNQFERPLRLLLEYLPQHGLALQRLLMGEASAEGDLNTLQGKVSEQFRRLSALHKLYGDPIDPRRLGMGSEDLLSLRPETLSREWEELWRGAFGMTPRGADALHAALIRDLKQLSCLIGDTTRLLGLPDLSSYYGMEITLIDLPEIQGLIHSLVAKGSEAMADAHLTEEERGSLSESASLLSWILHYSEERFGKIYTKELKKSPEEGLGSLFKNFSMAVRELTHFVKEKLLALPLQESSLSEFLTKAASARAASFELWDKAVDHLNGELLARREKLIEEALLLLLGASSLFFLALLLYHRESNLLEGRQGTLEIALLELQQGHQKASAEQEGMLLNLQEELKEGKERAALTGSSLNALSEGSNEAFNLLSQTDRSLKTAIFKLEESRNASKKLSIKLFQLQKRGEELSHGVEKMEQFAQQSHLFSINAAIEAEKAGESGKTFGAIAREIRRFGELMKQSTEELKKEMKEISSELSRGQSDVEGAFQSTQEAFDLSNELLAGQENVWKKVREHFSSLLNINMGLGL